MASAQWFPALVAALVLVSACGGGKDAPEGGPASPDDLRGGTIAVLSLAGGAAFETRYLLLEGYELDASPLDGGDVLLTEVPADSLAEQLLDGTIDAAAVSQLAAYDAVQNEDLRVLSEVTEELAGLTGGPVTDSVLLSYPDVAEQKGAALAEMDRLLDASLTYFRANPGQVLDAIAAEQDADAGYLRWWWDHNDLAFGDLSPALQQGVLRAWQAYVSLGDIETFPDLPSVLFDPEAGTAADSAAPGVRETVSLAVRDDPSRRAALYAIEHGLVASDSIDLNVTYLAAGALAEAATAKQFNVIEASPLIVPLGADAGIAYVIVSGGMQDESGTVLVVYRRP